ncbi:MAG: DUF3120 domain-containing protein [Oscillatoriales cyanobacterium SM2_2_1]|nr:DUF3120 domain-containing protein [Oscillatoriales cyanobacterium SM2_2_1]
MGILAIGLVSLPVFVEAPLVRVAPSLCLVISVLWLGLARLWRSPYGSLTWGFALTWLCGSVYWGWLRWFPEVHVPVEALALPWAVWGIAHPSHRVGAWFYFGSLLGTGITDFYFWVNDLFPHWQMLMGHETDLGMMHLVLDQALLAVQSLRGILWAILLSLVLLSITYACGRSPKLHHWVFGGAVLGTLLVDILFGLGALSR